MYSCFLQIKYFIFTFGYFFLKTFSSIPSIVGKIQFPFIAIVLKRFILTQFILNRSRQPRFHLRGHFFCNRASPTSPSLFVSSFIFIQRESNRYMQMELSVVQTMLNIHHSWGINRYALLAKFQIENQIQCLRRLTEKKTKCLSI